MVFRIFENQSAAGNVPQLSKKNMLIILIDLNTFLVLMTSCRYEPVQEKEKQPLP